MSSADFVQRKGSRAGVVPFDEGQDVVVGRHDASVGAAPDLALRDESEDGSRPD